MFYRLFALGQGTQCLELLKDTRKFYAFLQSLPLPIVQQTYFHEGVAVHLELSIKIIPLRVTVEILYYFICRSSSIILLSEINLISLA